MITRADVADLQPGDVVELTDLRHKEVVTRGPLRHEDDALMLGGFVIRGDDGSPWFSQERTLTVISRAKPPLYVNSDKTEPDAGDVVRDRDGEAWQFHRGEWYCASPDAVCDHDPDGMPIEYFAPLTLLWDGRTGQVVP